MAARPLKLVAGLLVMTGDGDILYQALALHQAGRTAEAAPLYRRIMALEPREPNALHLLGLILSRSDDPGAGERLMRRAVVSDPRLEGAYTNLSNFYRVRGRLDLSIDWLERGVAVLPASRPLREALCVQYHDWSVEALDAEDMPTVRERSRRCFGHLSAAPVFSQPLYELLEPQIRVALMAGETALAKALVGLRNRYDFQDVPAAAIDVFTVDMLGFHDWCARIGARTVTWQAPATLPDAGTMADYPDYLHPRLATLPELAAAPLGVALDAPVEVIQGFYVKDNYEAFIIANRETMLCENAVAVVRGARIPLIGVTPYARSAAFRLPRPLYREIRLSDPVIWLPSTPNYWHFMVDVLPMLMVRDQAPELRDRPILLFDVRPYQYEMLDLIGIPREQIIDVQGLVGAGVKQVVYHLERASIPSQVPYPIAYRWLRDCLLPNIRPDRPDYPRRVFLSRRSAYPKHRIANDTEVGALLARHGFTVVLPETLSVLETIEMIAGAEMVVAPIGAGTSNHIFLPPHGAWIHLNSPDFFFPESLWNRQMGVQATLTGHFRHLTGQFVGDPATFPTRDVDRLEIPIEINLAALERLIEQEEARLAAEAGRVAGS